MANGWTPERRARQAEMIKRWAPWSKSTGPRSEAGKAVASMNALKHGTWSAEWLAAKSDLDCLLKAYLRRQKDLVD
jgi:hypothetical protein